MQGRDDQPYIRHAGGLLSRINYRKVGIFIASLLLFMLALDLMRNGATGLIPLIRDILKVTNPANGLGFGWIFAYLIMSGSPVAAAALTFYDAGAVDQLSAFAMISGSRLGASLVVLILGLVYTLRGHKNISSLMTGVLALTVTATIYLPALPLGVLLMRTNLFQLGFDASHQQPSGFVSDVFSAPADLAGRYLPEWALFVVGLVIIIASFNLFDKVLPDLKLEDSAFGDVSRRLYRPIVVFGMGFVLTLLTMSVSVSLGLLVPLSARGYIRRENIIPYIMGCNISTFIDTLVAGLLLGNPGAATIVLTQMISVTLVSALILVVFMKPYQQIILHFVSWVDGSRVRLVSFFIIIFIVPITLLLIR